MGSQVGSSSVIFGIFLVSYFVTLWTFVVVYFWVGPQAVQWLRDLRPALGLGASDWLIWVSVGAFTGLPPFILFYAKVALLSLVFSSGGYGMAILCLGLVLIGWGVYVGALRQLVGSGWRGRGGGVRRGSKLAAWCLVGLVIVSLGGLGLGEGLVYASWVGP